GADVEVIEPHWLRETMKEKIREMAERYGEERD
ncbi:MAG: WYL domain-containing protein, partial [Prevotella sp.]